MKVRITKMAGWYDGSEATIGDVFEVIEDRPLWDSEKVIYVLAEDREKVNAGIAPIERFIAAEHCEIVQEVEHVHHLRQARVREEELTALEDFFEKLEDVVNTKDAREIGEFVEGEMAHLNFSVSRIVWGYRVMFENACDPDLDYLEWKPELKKVIGE